MILTYNGITLKLVKTNSFNQQPIMSSDGLDYVCMKVTIDVNAVYNSGATSYDAYGAATPGHLPAETDFSIRHALNEPRKPLIYADENGRTIISSPANGNTVDCQGGPTPLGVDVNHIAGTKTWHIRFRVETYIYECDGATSASTSPLASNRWSNTHSIGEDQRTTIVTNGVSQFRLDALESAGKTADFFRNVCLPPCPVGFRRMGISVQPNTVGNVVAWSTSDQEQYYYLGGEQSKHKDVLSFEGTFTESTTSNDKGMPSGLLSASATIRVMGKPRSLNANLLVFAVKLAINRLKIPPGGQANLDGARISRVSASEHMHAPGVDFHIETVLPAATNGQGGMGGLRAEFFQQDSVNFQTANPEFDLNGNTPQLGADNNTRTPSYNGLAFSSALQAACSTPQPIKSPTQGGSSSSASQSPPYAIPVQSSMSENLSSASTGYSESNLSGGAYTDYRIDSRIDTNHNIVMAPITGPASPGGSGGANATAEFMYVSAPTTTRVVNWSAERLGSAPDLPTPLVNDANQVLVRTEWLPTNVAKLTDGTSIFRVGGTFYYGLRNPIDAGSPNIPMCVTPNFDVKFEDVIVNAGQLIHGLIDSQSSSSGSSYGNDY
jgi:hypothetical protein